MRKWELVWRALDLLTAACDMQDVTGSARMPLGHRGAFNVIQRTLWEARETE
jgi:hypothetical protein